MSYKGDWSRVNDHKAYQDNYELIFKRPKDRPEEVQVCSEEGSRPNEQGEGSQESIADASDAQQDT